MSGDNVCTSPMIYWQRHIKSKQIHAVFNNLSKFRLAIRHFATSQQST